MLYTEERTHLLGVISNLLKFSLLDCTGGVMALRCSPNHLLMTTFGSAFRRWKLGLEDFIVTDNEGDLVEKHQHLGPSGLLVVLEIFKSFPLSNAVLHTHAEYSLAFASIERPIAPCIQLTQALGEVPCLRADDQQIKEEYLRNPYPVKVPTGMPNRPEIVAVNQRLVPQIEKELGDRKHELVHRGLAFTTYKHGLTAFAGNTDEAFDTLAQVEAAARTHIYGSLILAQERRENDEGP